MYGRELVVHFGRNKGSRKKNLFLVVRPLRPLFSIKKAENEFLQQKKFIQNIFLPNIATNLQKKTTDNITQQDRKTVEIITVLFP